MSKDTGNSKSNYLHQFRLEFSISCALGRKKSSKLGEELVMCTVCRGETRVVSWDRKRSYSVGKTQHVFMLSTSHTVN